MKRLRMLVLTGMLLAASSTYAGSLSSPEESPYQLAGEIFLPTSARVTGMGGSGLGMSGYSDAFLYNPAALGESRFRLSLPSISVTVFNARDIKDTDFFKDLRDGDWVSTLDDLMGVLTYGNNEIERIDAGIYGQFGHLGVALNTRERLFGYLDTSSYIDGHYFVEDTTALTVGLGYRFPLFSDTFSLDLGANVQFLYQVYTEEVDKETVDDWANNEVHNDFQLAAGWALPFTLGMNVNMPLGFRSSAVLRNLNGKFRYHFFDTIDSYSFSDSLKDKSATYDAGVRLDTGVSWTSPFERMNRFFKPTVQVDLYDVTDIRDKDDCFENLYMGAQFTLLSFMDVRFGLGQGYQSLGIGFDAFIFHVDCSYWRREYGDEFLDKSIDAVTLRFQLITR